MEPDPQDKLDMGLDDEGTEHDHSDADDVVSD